MGRYELIIAYLDREGLGVHSVPVQHVEPEGSEFIILD